GLDPEPPAVPHPRRRELHPRARLGARLGQRLRDRHEGGDAYRVQAQGRRQGRGSLEEPAQGVEEGSSGTRLSVAAVVFTLAVLWRSTTTARPDVIAFIRRRSGRGLPRARSTSSRRSTTRSTCSARAIACSISAARPARGCSTPTP